MRDPRCEMGDAGWAVGYRFSGRVGVSPAGFGILPKQSFQVRDRETRPPVGGTPTLPETIARRTRYRRSRIPHLASPRLRRGRVIVDDPPAGGRAAEEE